MVRRLWRVGDMNGKPATDQPKRYDSARVAMILLTRNTIELFAD